MTGSAKIHTDYYTHRTMRREFDDASDSDEDARERTMRRDAQLARSDKRDRILCASSVWLTPEIEAKFGPLIRTAIRKKFGDAEVCIINARKTFLVLIYDEEGALPPTTPPPN